MGDEITSGRGRPRQVKAQRPNALTAEKRQRFLDVLAATSNARRAARAAGPCVNAFYRLRSVDAQFAERWQQALADAAVRLEGEVLARALGEGDEPAGDGDRAGAAGRMDVALSLELLKRRDAMAARGQDRATVTQRRQIPIEEVERVLLARLDALARRAGRP